MQDWPWTFPTVKHLRTVPAVTFDPGENKYMRSLPFHWMILVVKGAVDISAFGKQIKAEQGACAYIGPHVPHHLSISRSAQYLWVHFHLYGIDPARQEAHPVNPGIPNLWVPSDVLSVRKHLLAILEELSLQQAGYQMSARARFMMVLTGLLRDIHDKDNVHHSWQVTDELIAGAIEYIHKNYLKKLSVEQVAQFASLSPNHFITRFGQVTGLSPGKYIVLVRIGHARHLLRSTDKSLTEVAEQSGFESLPHFSRTFKQYEGVTPSQFRLQS